MRSIEEKIDIPESRKDDFRREIMNYIGALAIEGKKFDYKTNERLHKALELKLFEDQKDSIKLTSLVSNVVDKETQEKIDVVKQRLIRTSATTRVSATDVLNYVASIFARGESAVTSAWSSRRPFARSTLESEASIWMLLPTVRRRRLWTSRVRGRGHSRSQVTVFDSSPS
jgi:hypothetical protein